MRVDPCQHEVRLRKRISISEQAARMAPLWPADKPLPGGERALRAIEVEMAKVGTAPFARSHELAALFREYRQVMMGMADA